MIEYNPLSLINSRFLVTGAASGIGKATSVILSKLGAKLILCDKNEEGLLTTQKDCGEGHSILLLDLTETHLIKVKVIEKINDFGKINGFVHLAGRPYLAPLKVISEANIKETFNINTYAALELAKVFNNKNVCVNHGASIVLVSSVYGCVGSSANVGYAMSKSALHGITKSLAIELAGKGIRVNCIAPGFVKTNMLNNISSSFSPEYMETIEKLHPLGLGEAEDVGLAVAYLLSNASKWVTGSIFNIDGGFTAQ